MDVRPLAASIALCAFCASASLACRNEVELPAPLPGGPNGVDDSGVPTDDAPPGDDASSDDTFDPGTEYVDPPDCGTLDGESDDADLSNGGILTGTRFCELYRDVFHHTTGSAKCQTLHCHGGDKGQHDLSMGWTKDECYAALTSFVAKFFEPDEQLVTPRARGDSTPISALPRYVDPDLADGGTPFMPQTKSYLGNRALSDAEWARVKGWLQRGAPND